jgi:hypothetical protein
MSVAFVDLSDFNPVKARSADILDAISLHIDDAAFMPVTQDLSGSKLAHMNAWIEAGCPQ